MLNNVKLMLVVLSVTLAFVHGDMYLRLEMDSFDNPNGVGHDSKCCFSSNASVAEKMCARKCATYFRFCLKSSPLAHECMVEFKTQIIGENTITTDQFKLTTSTLEFPLTNDQLDASADLKRIHLSVEVLNNLDSPLGEGQLISQWNLENIISSSKLDSWSKFTRSNDALGQKMTFNYKIECFNNYQGPFCQIRKWS